MLFIGNIGKTKKAILVSLSQMEHLGITFTDSMIKIVRTYSMGNQSPHSTLTLSMSSWHRRRSLISLSAVGGTTSVIHT